LYLRGDGFETCSRLVKIRWFRRKTPAQQRAALVRIVGAAQQQQKRKILRRDRRKR
jgi:hypothetical protein